MVVIAKDSDLTEVKRMLLLAQVGKQSEKYAKKKLKKLFKNKVFTQRMNTTY